jgi:hypothetical protein
LICFLDIGICWFIKYSIFGNIGEKFDECREDFYYNDDGNYVAYATTNSNGLIWYHLYNIVIFRAIIFLYESYSRKMLNSYSEKNQNFLISTYDLRKYWNIGGRFKNLMLGPLNSLKSIWLFRAELNVVWFFFK